MATSSRPTQGHYVDFDEFVDSRLERTRETIRSTDILVALVAASAAVLGYLLLFVLADHWIGMDFIPAAARLAVGAACVGGSIAWAAWKIGLPHRRRINRLFVAREIESHEHELSGNLVNLVDLQQTERDIARPVMRSIEKRAAVGLSQADIDNTVDRRPLMRSAYTLLGLVVASCVYTLLTFSLGLKPIGPSLLRAFGATSTAPTRIRIKSVEIQVGDENAFVDAETAPTVPARFQPRIRVTLNKPLEASDHATLYYSTADNRFVDQPLELRPSDSTLQSIGPEYEVTLLGEQDRGLLQDLTYHVTAGDATTQTFSIHVSTVPSAQVDSIDFQRPQYMQLETETRRGGHIDDWEGTRITLHATASQPVTAARIVFSDTEDTAQKAEEYPLHVENGTSLTGSWTLAFRDDDHENYPRFYRIVCRDKQGATDLHPTLHPISIRPDKAPEVTLLSPRADLSLPPDAVVPLLVKAHDPDFKLKHLTLRIERDGQQLVEHNKELFAGDQQSYGPQSFDLPLEPLGLQPGDTVSYWIEARDNKVPLGNRTNTAPKLNITITERVSPEDARRQQDELKQQQQKQLEEEKRREEEAATETTEDPSDDDGDTPPKDGGPDEKPGNGANSTPDNQTKDEPKATDNNENTTSDRNGNTGSKKNPGDNAEPQTKPQGGQEPDSKSTSGKADAADKNDKPQGDSPGPPQAQGDQPGPQRDDEATGNGKPNPDAKPMPLNTDGSDDDQALQKIRDFQNRQKNGQPGPGEAPKPAADESQDNTGNGNKGRNPNTETKSDRQNTTGTDKSSRPPNTQSKPKGDKTGSSPDKDDSRRKDKSDSPQSRKQDTGKATSPQDKKTRNGEPSNDPNKKTGSGNSDSRSKKEMGNNKKGMGDKKGTNKQTKPSQQSGNSATKNKTAKNDPRGTEPDNSGSTPKTKADSQKANGAKGNSGGSKTKKGKAGKMGDGASPDGESTGDGQKGGKTGRASGKRASKGTQDKNSDPNQAKASDASAKGDSAQQKDKKSRGKQNSHGDKKGAPNASGKSSTQPGQQPSNQDGNNGSKGTSGKNAVEGTGGTGSRPGTTQQGHEPQPGDKSESGAPDPPPAADAANEDFSKEGANLVLKRIEDEIQRGEVDPGLLEELGWSQDDVKQFAKRLRQQVDTPTNDTSPGAEARRRQFEDLLKSINIKSRGTRRTGPAERKRQTDSINAQDIPVPLQFREAVKNYRKNLSRRTRRSAPAKPKP